MRDVAIGVMAYNEEPNIVALLESLRAQRCAHRIARIVVVASGCTDRTVHLVQEQMTHDERIELIVQPQRLGKIAAINAFLQAAADPILVVSCADLLFEPWTLEALVKPLEDPHVGMVGAHPVPLNEERSLVGSAVRLMWDLHHRVSLVEPKMGELVAFRRGPRHLDVGALEDELLIEHHLRRAGFACAYAPHAIVRNRGPVRLREFMAQRVRCIIANHQSAREYAVHAPTMSLRILASVTRAYLRGNLVALPRVLASASIEALCRVRALVEYYLTSERERYRVWEPIASTKTLHR